MAISISKYISIQPKIITMDIGSRDFSGLIFTKVEMKSDAPASIKADYDGSKVVRLSLSEVNACFSDTSITTFAANYFSYNGGTKRPQVLNIALVGSSETAIDAYNRVVGGSTTVDAFTNFGSFAFLDSSFTIGQAESEGLLDVANANEANEYGWVFIIKTSASSQSDDSSALGSKTFVHLTHTIWEPMSWYASVDYDKVNAAGTIDYKQFANSVATVKTDADKVTADSLKVNYVGLVQNYGSGMKFYQTGVNLDGTDLGVVRDMCWINAEIVKGYFSLQNKLQKLPANYVGVSMVENVIMGVATRALANGAILLEKPLSPDQIAAIDAYAGVDSAHEYVSANGYYISATLSQNGEGKYVCQYTLVYAKGDHIVKVEGLSVLA